MANNITTNGSSAHPGLYSNQRRLDRTKNGVLWAMLSDRDNGRLEFHYSSNNGSTWNEDTSQRISGVDVGAGASFRIKTTAGKAERLGCIYRRASDNSMQVAFGLFTNSARTAFRWHSASPNEAARGVKWSTNHRRPDLEIHRENDRWIVPSVWGQLSGANKATVWMGNTRFIPGESSRSEPVNVHDRNNMSTTPRPSVSLRHLSDDDTVFDASPDLYFAWSQGVDTDPTDRAYMMRLTRTGKVKWQVGQLRVLEENGTQSGLTSSCFTGKRAAFAQVPSNMTDEILLHLMQPTDSSRLTEQVPSLGLGEITSVSITWDNFKSDIYILAAGTTNQRPHYIVYDWGTRSFGSWVEMNTDVVESDTLVAKPGSRGSRIECVYAVVSTSTTFRYQLVATTNVTPDATTWNTASGAHDIGSALLLDWNHNDVDQDAQSQYRLRRSINGGSNTYWNGSTWQSTSVDVSSATTSANQVAGWNGVVDGDVVEYVVRTNDGQGFGPYGPPLAVIASVPVNPTITAPPAGTFNSATVIVTWTVAEQTAFRARLLLTSDSSVQHDSGWVGDDDERDYEIPFLLVDGTNYTVQLQTQNQEGLASAVQTVLITASLTPPPLPTMVFTPIPSDGAITIDISNGTPGVGETDADRNSLWRRDDDDPDLTEKLVSNQGIAVNGSFTDRSIASDRNYSYKTTAYTAENATRESAYQS